MRLLKLLLAEADRGVKARLTASLLLVAAGGLLTALAPLALKNLVDALSGTATHGPPTLHALLAFTGAYLAALCLGRLLNEARPLLMGTAQQRLQSRMSRRFFAHVLDLPAGFHLNRQTGALSHTFSQASTAIQVLVVNLVQSLPITVELVTVIVVLTHLGQPALVAVFVASTAAYGLVFFAGAKRIRDGGRYVSASALATHATLTDTLLNIETIKCFGATSTSNRRFAAATEAMECSWSRLHRRRAELGLAVAMVFGASVASSLYVAVSAMQHGNLSIGGFVLCSVYMLQMVRPIEMLGTAARDVGQAVEFVRPMLQIVQELPEGTRAPASANFRPLKELGPMEVRLSGVSLTYPGGRSVLDRLSLHIPAGGRLAIVGATGSGKSSLVRLMLRLIEPDAGHILFDDVPGEQLHPAHVRARIGVVPQDVLLFDDTIAANVAIGRPDASQCEIESACRAARVHDFIASLPAGYGTRVGERGLRLSGGERQRIAIARAVLKRPRLCVFDEATSALDSHTETEILRDLPDMCRDCTMILITHRLAAARLADRIAVLAHGKVAELGTHDELLRAGGHYSRMWRLQALHSDHAHADPQH